MASLGSIYIPQTGSLTILAEAVEGGGSAVGLLRVRDPSPVIMARKLRNSHKPVIISKKRIMSDSMPNRSAESSWSGRFQLIDFLLQLSLLREIGIGLQQAFPGGDSALYVIFPGLQHNSFVEHGLRKARVAF